MGHTMRMLSQWCDYWSCEYGSDRDATSITRTRCCCNFCHMRNVVENRLEVPSSRHFIVLIFRQLGQFFQRTGVEQLGIVKVGFLEFKHPTRPELSGNRNTRGRMDLCRPIAPTVPGRSFNLSPGREKSPPRSRIKTNLKKTIVADWTRRSATSSTINHTVNPEPRTLA